MTPFPTTGILDDFNRADAGDLGANWTADPFNFADTSPDIISNACGTAVGESAYWNPVTFGPDSEVYLDAPTVEADSPTHRLGLRLLSPATAGVDGYALNVRPGLSAWTIARLDNGVFTTLGATVTQAVADGDAWGFEAIGSTLQGYQKPSAGSWTSIISRTDATYNSAGNLALLVRATTTRFDNFGGGTIPQARTRFRLPSAGSPAVSPAFQSYTHANGVRLPLLLVDSSALTTTAQTPDGADHLVAGDTSHVQAVSSSLAAQTIPSGMTVELAIQCLEAHAGNNLFLQLWVGIVSADGSTVLATLLAKTLDGLELATVLTNRYMNPTTTAGYTTTGGERLVVEISVSGTPVGAGGVQGHNASLRWGSDGAGGDLGKNDTDTGTTLNPWLETNELVFMLRQRQPVVVRQAVHRAAVR